MLNEPSMADRGATNRRTVRRGENRVEDSHKRAEVRDNPHDNAVDAENEEELVVAASQTGDGEPTVISTEDVRQGRRGENVSVILALSLVGAAGALAFVLFFFIL